MINFQIAVSTAEEEANYFTGDQIDVPPQNTAMFFPSGTYRVVNDKLYMIVQEPSPNLPE